MLVEVGCEAWKELNKFLAFPPLHDYHYIISLGSLT
jgi:hypothetical protein